MQVSKVLFLVLISICFSCKKEIPMNKESQPGNTIYQVDTIPVYNSALQKTKQKSGSQQISILYNDLFQKSIPSKELNDLSVLDLSVGDKKLSRQLIAGNYMNKAGVKIVDNTTMRADPGLFTEETYMRFYLRKPTELEKDYFIKLIKNDASITPEMIYTAFTESNEYSFY